MIDVNVPSSLAGILLVGIVAFVVISALITSGIFPVIIALVLAAVVGYALYIVLTALHRMIMYGGSS